MHLVNLPTFPKSPAYGWRMLLPCSWSISVSMNICKTKITICGIRGPPVHVNEAVGVITVATLCKHMWFGDVIIPLQLLIYKIFKCLPSWAMRNRNPLEFYQYTLTAPSWLIGNLFHSTVYQCSVDNTLLPASVISYAWHPFCGAEC